MRITIEALGISGPGGGRSATLGTLNALFAIDAENLYDVWLDTPEPSLKGAVGNVRQHILPIHNRFIARLALQAFLPIQTRYSGTDIVHFTKNLTTAYISGKTIVTLHDLANLTRPDLFNKFDNWYWRKIQPLTFQRASHVIVISAQTAHDLQYYYHIPDSKISIIYNSYHPRFKPSNEETIRIVRERYHLPNHYILHVGALSPKKNLRVLIESFGKARGNGYKGGLVLVGPRYNKLRDDHLEELVSTLNLSDYVRFTGSVSDDDLPKIYSGADLFVFPSHYEGFGIAAIEAMACGIPVIASSTGALPEVVGDAALLLRNLQDDVELSTLMLRILNDQDLASNLVHKGLVRCINFTQDKIAEQTLKVYRSVYSGNEQKSSLTHKTS